ncbi:MBL fold metallo-hydrolase [Brucellaceae bacterium C25G]
MGQLQAIIIPVTAFQQNCTLLFDSETKKGVVIDPGGNADRIVEAVKAHNVEVEAIWLTHGHLDHVGGALDLKEALNVNIIGPHIDDQDIMASVESSAARYNLPDKMRNLASDQWLNEGDHVSFAGHDFEVLHCPGHSPGHVVFYNKAASFALVGDVLFNGSVGRTDLPGGDHEALMSSIKNKLLPLGDEIGFLCGHGPGSRFGDERRGNPFLV